MTRDGDRARAGAWGARAATAGLLLGLAMASGLGGGCGGAAPADAPKPPARSVAKSDFDPCAGKEPPARAYDGVAREARCDQEVFLTMAATAGALGRDCEDCHVKKEGGEADALDYPSMTDQKRIANWMKHTFVDRLRNVDGTPVKCGSCHAHGAKDGKPAAKFLGTPRDAKYAMEWMNLVMVNQFRTADGGKVTCKLCHAGLPSTPAFQTKVILRDDVVKLPPRTDLPPPGRPAPTDPAAPAAAPAPESPSAGPSAAPPLAAPAAPSAAPVSSPAH